MKFRTRTIPSKPTRGVKLDHFFSKVKVKVRQSAHLGGVDLVSAFPGENSGQRDAYREGNDRYEQCVLDQRTQQGHSGSLRDRHSLTSHWLDSLTLAINRCLRAFLPGWNGLDDFDAKVQLEICQVRNGCQSDYLLKRRTSDKIHHTNSS